MVLDPNTLIAVNVVNLLALATLLPIIMGRTLSPAARAARLSLIVHAAAWVAVILSEKWGDAWPNLALSAFSMACFSTSNWLLFNALSNWLGLRPFGATLRWLAIAMPIGYIALFDSYTARVGWANALIAAQLAIVARATLYPHSKLQGRWRYAMFICSSLMAGLTLARGVLGAFFPELYPSFAAAHPVNLAAMLTANASLVLSNMSVLVAWREEAEQQLRDQAMIDPLTGLLNRRGWQEQGERIFSNARRYGHPLALLAIDLDYFKQINDHYGHEKGDAALRLFGEKLRRHQRVGDIVARLGGEEFCILLPMAHGQAARAFDRRLREALGPQAQARLGLALDYSAGLACLGPNDANLAALLQRADQALYAAKQAGRGQLLEQAPQATSH
ncbi:MAG: GGDEF domain-containing protein [Rhodocyclales bacterium GT-UBC]|nr:MAG: GGDEF domain-containing protein [Rhodocyclales bacterium GT-UBC]